MKIFQVDSKDEINQPMFATSVGLIMRGFDYLETFKSTLMQVPELMKNTIS